MTKVRAKCYRLVHNGRWGIVDFNGREWMARVAFYQKTGSRGPVVKPKSKRMPRYRRVGFFPNRWKATDALCRVLDPRYARARLFAELAPPKIDPKFVKRYAEVKLNKRLYGKSQ